MKLLTIIKYDLKKLVRDKVALMFMIAMPVVFTYILGNVFGSQGGSETVDMSEAKLSIVVTDLDNSELSKRLIEEFEKDGSTYIDIVDEERLRERVKSTESEAGFIIPNGFEKSILAGETGNIISVKLPTSVDYMAIQMIISNSFSKLMIEDSIMTYIKIKSDENNTTVDPKLIDGIKANIKIKLDEPNNVTTNKTRYYKDQKVIQYNGKAQLSMGYLVMFVMFAVVFGAGEILDERKNNTWERLVIAPIGMGKIIGGKLLANYLRGAMQLSFLIIFGALALGVSWGNSIWGTVLLSIAFLFAATGLGTLFSSIVKTNAQLGSYGTIVLLVSTSLSGCWWPIEMSPKIIQQIAMIFPQYWAMMGYKNTVVANLGIDSVIEPVIVLMIMALIFYTMTIIFGGFKISSKPIRVDKSVID